MDHAQVPGPPPVASLWWKTTQGTKHYILSRMKAWVLSPLQKIFFDIKSDPRSVAGFGNLSSLTSAIRPIPWFLRPTALPYTARFTLSIVLWAFAQSYLLQKLFTCSVPPQSSELVLLKILLWVGQAVYLSAYLLQGARFVFFPEISTCKGPVREITHSKGAHLNG